MSMLDRLPTVSEMIAALESPVSPKTQSREADMNLSTDDMIREMFSILKGNSQSVGVSAGPRARDSSYNSMSDTYNGLPATSQYNGTGL